MNSLVFSTARIKTRENSLLTLDKLMRLLDQSDISECLKVLVECGYAVGDGDYNNAITAEVNKSCDYCKSIMPNGYGLDLFFCEFDYHNLKAILKAKYASLSSWTEMLAPEGNLSSDSIYKAVFEGVSGNLPIGLDEVIKKLENYATEHTVTAKMIDLTCDRRTYADIFVKIKKVKGNKVSFEKYFKSKIDFANLGTFFRSKKQKLDKDLFIESFIEGGNLKQSSFIKIYEENIESILNEFKGSDYYFVMTQGVEEFNKPSFSEFEVKCENYLLNIFKKEKHDMFSSACIAGYLVGKMTEAKNIRIILTGVKNSVDKNIIKIRLRELYA